MLEGAHPQGEPRVAAQRHGQRGCARVPVARIGDDDDVGAERIGVVGEELGERARARLLLALDEQRDTEVEVRAQSLLEGAQRRDVRHDPRLVVGGSAAVQAPAADGRLERRGLPERFVADRLHVVVRVEQDRRPAVARGA